MASSSPPQDINGGEQLDRQRSPASQRTPVKITQIPDQNTNDTSTVVSASVPPFPSTSDVLQPLSHRTPLPTSGSVAAAVKQRSDCNLEEQQGKKRQGTVFDKHECSHHQLDHSRLVDPQRSTIQRQQQPGKAVYPHPPSPSHRSHSCPDMCYAKSADTQWPPSRSPAAVSESGLEFDSQMTSRYDKSSVQKRSETVQFLHERDGLGLRSWKRVIVEYS